MSTEATATKTGFALKGGMFTLTAIQLLDYNLEELSRQLDDKINQAPNFFQFAPIIIDLRLLKEETDQIEFALLIHLLKSKKLIPIGVRSIRSDLKNAAIAAGLAIFPEEKATHKKSLTCEEKPHENINSESPSQVNIGPITLQAEPNPHTATRVITQPVRSGQQIYAPGGDLIVLSAVSHGAEILADGHIHVYGPLRGRALAGVMGNQEAMIFCRSLEAELVSIAGQYRMSEDLKENNWKQSVCIQLDDNRLNIELI